MNTKAMKQENTSSLLQQKVSSEASSHMWRLVNA